ncbi:peptidase M56 BlaR1 [Paenibacillus senegalensis]|uniref:peptidase M56 BlaR1 n=1 Tax=Paenibacillus senegalensis TaxID=1465766 RepID=UPI00028824CA|nr:peptidase M56 BlaR1 [Paenibacillus senegalensis]
MTSSLFIAVLNMSLTASYVALIVIAIRFILKNLRAPAVFSYALWLVVLFRLVLPFSYESSLSLLPGKTAAIPHNIMYSESPSISTGILFLDHTVNRTIQSAVLPVDETASVNPMEIVVEAGAAIWLLGIAVLLLYGVISYFQVKQKLTFATRVKDNVFETDRIQTPFVLGLIKPKIYLPTGLTRQEQQFIFMHEQTHIRRFDYVIKPLAFLTLVLHWFNPLMWLSYFLMIRDMEMSCDEKVMQLSKEDLRIDYSRTLLALASKQSGLASPLSFGESNVKSRVRNILLFKRPVFWVSVVITVIVAALAISLLANPAQEAQVEGERIVSVQGVVSSEYSVYEGHLIPFADFPIGRPIDTFIVEVENLLFEVEPADFEKYGGGRTVEIQYLNTDVTYLNEVESIAADGTVIQSDKPRPLYRIVSITGDPHPQFD